MKRIYIGEDLCMGCGLCKVYCATEHSMSKYIIKAHKRELSKKMSLKRPGVMPSPGRL